MNINESELVNQFMKVTNISNKNFALAYLKKNKFDIENAIDEFFDNNNIDPCNINNNDLLTEKNLSNILTNFMSLEMCKNCIKNRDTINSIFDGIPALINKNHLEKYLQKKLCLFFIYNDESFEILKKFLDFIKKNLYIILKIQKYCVVLKDNYFNSGIELKLDKALNCPVLLFCYNNLNKKGFIKSSVKEIYEIKNNNINNFPKFFLQALKKYKEQNKEIESETKEIEINNKEEKNEVINDNNNNEKDNDNNNNNNKISNTNFINSKVNKKNSLKNVKTINKIFLQKPKEAKNKLPEEPNLNDLNTILIQFQFPSDKRIERKFLISDKVELLYTYLISLDDQLYSELESKEFFLAFSQPYFPLKEEYFEKTLFELNFNKTQILVILDLED
jgi:hypothetical protein